MLLADGMILGDECDRLTEGTGQSSVSAVS